MILAAFMSAPTLVYLFSSSHCSLQGRFQHFHARGWAAVGATNFDGHAGASRTIKISFGFLIRRYRLQDRIDNDIGLGLLVSLFVCFFYLPCRLIACPFCLLAATVTGEVN